MVEAIQNSRHISDRSLILALNRLCLSIVLSTPVAAFKQVILSILKNIVESIPSSIFLFPKLQSELSVFGVQIKFFSRCLCQVRCIDHFWWTILCLENELSIFPLNLIVISIIRVIYSFCYDKNLFFIEKTPNFSGAFEKSAQCVFFL